MGRYIDIFAQSPSLTLTGREGGNLGYVETPVSSNQNLGSDVDKENPTNQLKAMDARNGQNAKKMMSLNEQEGAGSDEDGSGALSAGNEVGEPLGGLPWAGDKADAPTSEGLTARELVDRMKEERAEIDREYQRRLSRARMFEALHRGLSALTQYGAKTNGNAALPYDDSVWKAVQTELGQRWRQNREDLLSTQRYDTERMKLSNAFEGTQVRNGIAQQNADTNRMNAETRRKATESRNQLTQSQIAANDALAKYREQRTDDSKKTAEALIKVYEARVQNYKDQMELRGEDVGNDKAYHDALLEIRKMEADIKAADVVTTEDDGFSTTTRRVHKDVGTGASGGAKKKKNPYQSTKKKSRPY